MNFMEAIAVVVARILALSSPLLISQRIGASFMIQLQHCLMDGAVQVIGTAEGLMSQMMAFEIAPDLFDVVQFRGVFW